MRKLLVGLVVSALFCATLAAADVTGAWAIEFETDVGGNTYRAECAFKQEGQKLAGSCSGAVPGSAPVPITGDVKGRTVSFQYNTGLGDGVTVAFSGELDESETALDGAWRFVDQEGNKGTGTFTARKH